MVSRDSGWYARPMNSRLIEEMARKCVTVDVEGEKQMDIRKERVKSDEPQRSAVQHQATIAWVLRKERKDIDLSLGAAETATVHTASYPIRNTIADHQRSGQRCESWWSWCARAYYDALHIYSCSSRLQAMQCLATPLPPYSPIRHTDLTQGMPSLLSTSLARRSRSPRHPQGRRARRIRSFASKGAGQCGS